MEIRETGEMNPFAQPEFGKFDLSKLPIDWSRFKEADVRMMGEKFIKTRDEQLRQLRKKQYQHEKENRGFDKAYDGYFADSDSAMPGGNLSGLKKQPKKR